MLGPAQERWLLQNLTQSSATWNILAQQVMMTETDQTPGDEIAYWTDEWAGYPAARDRILQAVMERPVENFVVLTGDVHAGLANDLKSDWSDPASPAIGAEYICTSISAGGPEPYDWFGEFLPATPYVHHFDPRHGGFCAVEVTPQRWTTEYLLVEDLEQVDSATTRVASFVTETGRPGVQTG